MSAPLPRGWPHPQVVPFETLSPRSIEGKCFRFDSQLQDLTGNREFDLQRPEHHLTFYAQGPPMLIAARMDSGPFERFALSPGQVTLLPSGQRAHGWADGLGTRGEMRLSFGPEFISQAIGAEVQASRVELVRSMDLRNPSIVQALAALGREVEQPGPMGRVYTESLVVLVVTELVRHHSTLAVGADRLEDVPSRPYWLLSPSAENRASRRPSVVVMQPIEDRVCDDTTICLDQSRYRLFLPKPLVWPGPVVEVGELRDETLKMGLAKHEDMVEQFAPQSADKALGEGVHVRGPDRGANDLGADGFEQAREPSA